MQSGRFPRALLVREASSIPVTAAGEFTREAHPGNFGWNRRMIRPRGSLSSLAPAPSRDFPALPRVLPFTLPYRMQVIGSTVSQALRNALLLVGGLAMLAVTSIKLTLLVLLIVPVVIVPILFYGRRVRRLSRDTQDAIAAFAAYAEETINAIRTVQAFTHEAMDRARFGTRVETAFAVARQRIVVRAVLTGIVILLAFGAIT